MGWLVLFVQITISLWLCYRLIVIPAFYTRMGLRSGGRLSRGWLKNLGKLIWFPMIVLFAACIWWLL